MRRYIYIFLLNLMAFPCVLRAEPPLNNTDELSSKDNVEPALETKTKGHFGDSLLRKTLMDMSARHPAVMAKAKIVTGKINMSAYKDWIYPDPAFGIAWSNFPYHKDLRLEKDRTAMTGIEFKLSQPIPFPGKLSADANVATTEVRLARLEMALEKNNLSREFLSLLIQYRLQSELLALSQEISQSVRLIFASSRSAYSVGKLTLDRVQFVDIASERFDDRMQSQKGALQAILEEYKYFNYIQNKAEFMPEVDVLIQNQNLEKYLGDLEKAVESGNCDLKKCSIAVAMQQAEHSKQNSIHTRAQMDYLPDSEIFASYRKREKVENDPVIGEDFFSFGVTMKIPLWSALSNHNKVSSVSDSRQAIRFSQNNVYEKEQSEFASIGRDISTMNKRLTRYNTRLIPKAQSALDSLKESYRSGRADLYDLLGAYEILYSLKSEALQLKSTKDTSLLKKAMIVNSILPQMGNGKIEEK